MTRPLLIVLMMLMLASAPPARGQSGGERPRAREVGVVVGILPPGPLNAITDVEGVRVGHATVTRGDSVRTGVTAILPHGGNVFQEKVPAAVHVGNGFGKLLGVTQVRELGELETPILLTCTLCVWQAADAMVDTLLARPDMQHVRSINPVVGETNDGYLNAIRARPVRPEHVREALRTASGGAVEEGSVGAGMGTVAFGWKGGIGTSSRVLPEALGGHTVGVLVQTNFGGVLTINGAPVGRELGQFIFDDDLGESDLRNTDVGAHPKGTSSLRSGRRHAVPSRDENDLPPGASADGSIMIVVATDAPLQSRNLERLARRALFGLARTGATMTNGSGDYGVAFSTVPKVEIAEPVENSAMSPLFQAVAEAAEEAVYNSLFRATTVTGRDGHTARALPIERTLEILERYNALGWDRTLPPQR